MPNPLIAVVGSLDPGRVDELELERAQLAHADTALLQIGRELARKNCRLAVYDSRPMFIEAKVVQGFVAQDPCRESAIEVHHEQARRVRFKDQEAHEKLFDFFPDPSSSWESSYYKSLHTVEGVVLVGGGWSTLITGVIALTQRKALAPVATFGGQARKVWGLLRPGPDLISEVDHRALGASEWNNALAVRVANTILDQIDAKRAAEKRRKQAGSRRATVERQVSGGLIGLLSIAACTAAVSWLWEQAPWLFAVAAFVVVPCLAGAAGGLTWLLRRLEHTPEADMSLLRPAALGIAAGLISAALFVLAQMFAIPDIKADDGQLFAALRRLAPFELIVGFIAGLTFDAVFTKLSAIDAVPSDALGSKMTRNK
ncbi:MAG: hypothetical protein WA970_10030 [Gammaproteobacteria bacterium]